MSGENFLTRLEPEITAHWKIFISTTPSIITKEYSLDDNLNLIRWKEERERVREKKKELGDVVSLFWRPGPYFFFFSFFSKRGKLLYKHTHGMLEKVNVARPLISNRTVITQNAKLDENDTS